jgi:GTP-binding protein
VAFAGRSNVGKSSLINCLVGRKNLARVSSKPGRTQLINFFSVNDRWMLVDLPGYGFAKVPDRVRASWGPMIEEFFTESPHLKLAVLIVDARHPPSDMDRVMATWLRDLRVSCQVTATKVDKVPKSRRRNDLDRIGESLEVPSVIPFSAVTGEGRGRLWEAIESCV